MLAPWLFKQLFCRSDHACPSFLKAVLEAQARREVRAARAHKAPMAATALVKKGEARGLHALQDCVLAGHSIMY